MRVRKMLNVLVLLAMALGLFLAPAGSVSADPEAPLAKVVEQQGYARPCHGGAQVYYRFDFQTFIELDGSTGDKIKINFPPGVYVPLLDDTKQEDLNKVAIANVARGDQEQLNNALGYPPRTITYYPDEYEEWNLATRQAYTGWVRIELYPLQGSDGALPPGTRPSPNTMNEEDYVKVEFFGPERTDPVLPKDSPVPETNGTKWDDPAWPLWDPITPTIPTKNNAASYNPGASGFESPDLEAGETYTVQIGLEDEWQTVTFVVCERPPVKLYLKWQVPTAACGWSDLERIAEFDTIQAALDAANGIWNQTGPYAVGNPKWNLYKNCPTSAAGPIPVGAVVAVEPGTYTETIEIDTPGVTVGSTDGPDVTIIEARGVRSVRDQAAGTWWQSGWAAVEISAGGVTFGEATIKTGSCPDEYFQLQGFTVQNAGRDVQYDVGDIGGDLDGEKGTPEDGEDLDADGDLWEDVPYASVNAWALGSAKCTEDVDVYSNAVIATGTFTRVLTNTLTLSVTTGFDAIGLGAKVVDLGENAGWAGYVTGLVKNNPFVTVTVAMTQPWKAGDMVTPTFEWFGAGNAFAVFTPTADFDCPDARIDIRGNVIKNGTRMGIWADMSAVWVDSNEVYDHETDGFFGNALKSCGSLAVCDGLRPPAGMNELSNNHFYDNGNAGEYGGCWYDNPATTDVYDPVVCTNMYDPAGDPFAGNDSWYVPPDAGYACEDQADEFCGEFDPDETNGDDSGIEIMSTGFDCPAGGCERGNPTGEDLYIHDNVIETNVHAGIWLQEEAANSGTRILWNDILDNEIFGLSSEAECAVRDTGVFTEPTMHKEIDVIFKYNNVTGNGNLDGAYYGWGVKNWAWDPDSIRHTAVVTGMLNAKENYWNDECGGTGGESPVQVVCPSGPADGPAPCAHKEDQRWSADPYNYPLYGLGDAVDKGTFYNPWLAVNSFELRPGDCGDSHLCPYQDMRIYGSDSLMLQAGWNTLAAPLPLHTEYNTLASIRDLGYFLEDEEGNKKYEVAFGYENTDGSWDTNPTFDVLHGYFIKLKEPTRFPVIYGEAPFMNPAYSLFDDDPSDPNVNGWNLIGAPFGIDKEIDCTDEADQGRYGVADPDDAFAVNGNNPTIGMYQENEAWMKAGEAFGASINPELLVSPGVFGQIPDENNNKGWIVTALGTKAIYAGQGYWAYMGADDTLAGFESAPLFFEDGLPDK